LFHLNSFNTAMKFFSRLKSKFLRIVILILDCPTGTVGGLIAIAKNPFSSRYFCRKIAFSSWPTIIDKM